MLACLQPFNCFYRHARYELAVTLLDIFKAPFVYVKFRDFFMADILTSIKGSLIDIGYMAYYFGNGNYLTQNPLGIHESSFYKWWVIVMSFAPFWWRFWQCIYKFYNFKDFKQFVNSMKYASKFIPTIVVLLGNKKKFGTDVTFWWYFGAELWATLFSLYWDFRWDWGMFIGTTRETRFIRDQTKFKKSFYYFCMVQNLVFRFWWVPNCITIRYYGHLLWFDALGVMAFISAVVEIVRRTIWAILRVENEFFNNFE